MERIIETERTYLRQFMLKDASALFKMNSNPNVLEFTGDVPFKNILEAETFIKNYKYCSNYNMGRWAVCGKRQGEFLGWCGLKHHREEGYIDIGYRFFEKHWNKGLATEAATGVISYAFNKLRLQNIYAYVDSRNIASIKVAENSGLVFQKETLHEGNLTKIYHLKNSLVEVRKITTEDTYKIRQQVLRQGKPLESCKFGGDNLPTTFHIGLFYYGELIGIATFMQNNNPNFTIKNQFQLRGMAILQQFQGKKFGDVLLTQGITLLQQQNTNLVWCNARATATNFYENFGFTKTGNSFQIPEIGTHFVMHKEIN